MRILAANDGAEIPHEAIRETHDRSWTSGLVARLAMHGLAEEDASDLSFTLQMLHDPRSEAPLARILADRALPAVQREAAGWSLRMMGAVTPPAIRAMMRNGDEVEQRHALLAMDHGEADLLEPIARDPDHPLHLDAIMTMEHGFEEPRFIALKVAALGHHDARVRAAAADSLALDAPIDAESALIRASTEPTASVASAALAALQYYKTRRSIAALAAARGRGGGVGAQADECLDEVRSSFQRELCDAGAKERAALIAWLAPVWEILAFEEDELHHEPVRPSDPPFARDRARLDAHAIDASSLLADLSDPDGPWRRKLRRLRDADPAQFAPADRPRLASFFVSHPDAGVRADCAHLLAGWGDHASLIRLTGDPRFLVMKQAMYELAAAPPNDAAAACARAHLDGPRVTSTHAYETLETYVAHARPASARRLLAERAIADEREVVRRHAVHALAKLGAKAEIEALLPLLAAPPRLTWSVHLALLDAARGFGVTPRAQDLELLRDADDLDVQRALPR